MMVNSQNQNIHFGRPMVEEMLKLSNQYNLDACFMLGKADDSWTEEQKKKYIQNTGRGVAWRIPAISDPMVNRGLFVKTKANEDGVYADIQLHHMNTPLPFDVMGFKYDSIVAYFVRGIKRSGEAKLIVCTGTVEDWPVKLDKELRKLKPVTTGDFPLFFWDNITDVVLL